MVNSILVIGAGLMGRGITQVLIVSEFNVKLVDVNTNILDAASEEIRNRLLRRVEKKEINEQEYNSILSRLETSTDMINGFKSVDLVIEAVPENLELKQNLLKQLHDLNPNVIFASNTSSLSIKSIAEATPYADLVIGMHWFNPPAVMKLVEIVHSDVTSKNTIATIQQISAKCGKTSILVKDYPGFATSRLGVVIGLEAIRMLEQGVASAHDIDTAMVLGYRFPMGPLELTDYIGLDTRLSIAEYINGSGVSSAFEIPNLLKQMVSEGKLGRKSGEGFYQWKDGKKLSNYQA
jgi:3-hydroxybutyryl-CoA dehydrogenase